MCHKWMRRASVSARNRMKTISFPYTHTHTHTHRHTQTQSHNTHTHAHTLVKNIFFLHLHLHLHTQHVVTVKRHCNESPVVAEGIWLNRFTTGIMVRSRSVLGSLNLPVPNRKFQQEHPLKSEFQLSKSDEPRQPRLHNTTWLPLHIEFISISVSLNLDTQYCPTSICGHVAIGPVTPWRSCQRSMKL